MIDGLMRAKRVGCVATHGSKQILWVVWKRIAHTLCVTIEHTVGFFSEARPMAQFTSQTHSDLISGDDQTLPWPCC